MAQVVQSKGWVGPLVTMVIGVILMLNGVPALIQWVPWLAQASIAMGTDSALETALVPLMLAGAASFIGFLMLRGGFSALRERARGAAKRTQEQVRSGVQQVRREATQRYGEATSQAEHLVNKVPQSWRERIQAAATAVEKERAARAVSTAHPEWEGQGARRAAEQPQAYRGQGQQQGQGQRMQRGYELQEQAQQRQQLPGGERLSRIEELRARVDSKTQQASQAQEAARQADQVRRAAKAAADRVQHGMPMHLDEATEALVGRLDLFDAERIRRRGSSLTRSSLTTSALRKTSLSTNSLFRHR